MDRKKQIKYYCDLLKENEILLLKSSDAFFKNHYEGSPLNILTNFSGSSAEAIINKEGKIRIFVDTRYHILVDKQVHSDIEVYKMDFGETFIEAFKKCYKKDTILHVCSDISLNEYLKLDKYFDLRTYKLNSKFLKNLEFDKKTPVCLIDKDIKEGDFQTKVEKLANTNQKIDKMVVFDLDKIAYLTNLRSFQMKYSSLFKSILYLDFKNSNYILFVDYPIKENIPGLNYKKIDEFLSFIQSQNDDIYIEHNDITLENFLAIKKPKEIKQNNLSLLSSIKSLGAIEEMKNTSYKLDCAILNFKKHLKEGLSEYDLVKIFEDELLKQGLVCPSFKTILALDENTASIHYSSYDKKKFLKQESLILLDCGAYSKAGFATDITRTFYFGKNPQTIYKKIYTNVLKAFILCFKSKDTNARTLDLIARDFLSEFEQKGFYFNHGLGHGIGTSCHQNPPLLSISSKDTIKPYQTHSIEPGLYGKKDNFEFGVRIENCVYFDINYKRFSLSKFPFDEVLIDYSLLNQEEENFVKKWQEGFKINECN